MIEIKKLLILMRYEMFLERRLVYYIRKNIFRENILCIRIK